MLDIFSKHEDNDCKHEYHNRVYRKLTASYFCGTLELFLGFRKMEDITMLSEMTSKERVLAAINHQPVDRIPTDYWGTWETTQKLIKALGVKDEIELFQHLEIDKFAGIGAPYIGPPLPKDDEVRTDCWGIKYVNVPYADGAGSYEEECFHPLAQYETIDEIEANYTWPKVEWFDFDGVPAQFDEMPDHATWGGYIAPFYFLTKLRGMEQSLMDMAAEPELTEYIVGKICDYFYDFHTKLFDAADGRLDISQLTDDFGSQQGLMISPDMFDRYFKKHYERFVKLMKSYNIKVFHHDCGAIMKLLPALVDVGIDILNPIQWHLPGMDLKELKDRFGKQICFHGGIDNQDVLPFGTVEDVKREVATCLDVLASDGTGYILAPCHNLQVITPVENVVTMYRTAKELGRRSG